jgi:hypothetical protein
VQTGHVLLGCGGEPIWSAEAAYNTVGGIGGPVSRLVAHGRFAQPVQDGGIAGYPLVSIPGYGNALWLLALQGLWDDDALPTDVYPISGLEIDDAGAHTGDERAWIGIQIEGQQGGLGTGKLAVASTLAIMYFRAAIKCTNVPNDNNADQIILQRFFAPFCDIGLWSINEQSVGHRVAHFDQIHCNTGFRYDAGGKLWCGNLVMQNHSQYGLLITGTDSTIGGNSAAFRIDRLTIDGTAPSDCEAVHIEPPTADPPDPDPYCFAMVDIGFLHVNSVRAGQSSPEPLIVVERFYGEVNIYGGVYLYEGMIKFTGGNENFFPTIRIHNARFVNGADPRNVFHADSSGFAQYEFISCCEIDGTGAANDGKMFPDFRGFLSFATAPPTILLGGYIFRRGAIVNISTPSATYNANHFDETIVFSGGAATLNLPPAEFARGIIFRIKNSASSGSVTIDPYMTQLIEGASTYTLAALSRVTIECDGSGWILV